MSKKFLALLCTLALLVSILSGCAPKQEEQPVTEIPSGTETPSNTTPDPSVPEEPTPQQPTDVTETPPVQTPVENDPTTPAQPEENQPTPTVPSGTTDPVVTKPSAPTAPAKPTTPTAPTKPSTPSNPTTTPKPGTTTPPKTTTPTPKPPVSGNGTSSVSVNIPKTFPIVKQDASATVVSFWHAMTGRYAPLVDNIANWYNATKGKEKKIYVKSIFQGDYDAITIKIQAALQANNAKQLPDLVQLSAQGAFSIKDSSSILYMEDLIEADPSFTIRDKLNKNAMWASSYKGRQLGLPFSNSMIVMHYNVPAFQAAGLDPSNPPKTLAEYAAAASKLVIMGSGKKPVRYGASNKISAYHLSTWIPRQKSGTAFQFDKEDGRQAVPTVYTAGTDGTLEATLAAWKTVLDTGVIDYATAAPRANFEQGQTAMYMDSMVQYDTIEQYFNSVPAKDKAKKVFEHGMYRIPQVSATDSIGEAIGGSAVYMFNKGDAAKKAATWDFVKFLASVDVSAYWYVQSGYYPLNGDAVKTSYVQSELSANPGKKQLLTIRSDSASSYKFQEPWIPSYSIYSNTVGDQASLLGQGKQTLNQTTENIAKKANSILSTYWNANK